MIKILLATHSTLCCGMLETAKLFIENVDHLTAIPFYTQKEGYDAEKEMMTYIEQICEDDIVFILTDILWGSVNQKVYVQANEKKNVHVISGLNLPLLLEIMTMNPDDITQNSVAEKVKNCRESLVYMREFVIESNENDE